MRIDSHVRSRTVFLVALVIGAVPAITSPASAQSMSFSVYQDAALSNAFLVHGYVTVQDNSWGCTHGNYSTTANIYSPTGRNNPGTSGGLYSNTTLSMNGEEGNYTVVGLGSYSCSCSQFGVPGRFGGSRSYGVGLAQTYYQGCYQTGSNSCYCPYLACVDGSAPRCGIGTATLTVSACTNFMGAKYGVLTWGDDYWCTLGWSWSATGKGLCY